MVIDTETRHFVRPEQLQGRLDIDGPIDDAIAEPAPKTVFPKDVSPESAGVHTVAYSDVDILGHTNNASYMVWTMDALDYAFLSGRRPRDIYLNFNKETTPGTPVALFRCTEGDACYVDGRVDGKSVFCAKIQF